MAWKRNYKFIVTKLWRPFSLTTSAKRSCWISLTEAKESSASQSTSQPASNTDPAAVMNCMFSNLCKNTFLTVKFGWMCCFRCFLYVQLKSNSIFHLFEFFRNKSKNKKYVWFKCKKKKCDQEIKCKKWCTESYK